MNIPFLDLRANARTVKSEVLARIEEIIDNSAFVGGKYVASFETRFAAMHAVDHCIAVSSGTAGNHLALWALGIGSGDEVIVPVNTFIATAWGATLCGATPVFVDNDPLSYTIDPNKVEEAITSRTKAIVAVHLYGQSADIDPLRKIADRHGLYLVEDAAQAHLATYNGVPVGNFGITSSFSFYPGKNLGAFGEGGAVVTNDADIAKHIAMIKDHGSAQKYYHPIEGHNYRMSHIIGASLDAKLAHLEAWTDARRSRAALYRKYLADIAEVVLPEEIPYAKHVYHLFVIRTERRDALAAHLQAHGIASGMHYPLPLHRQEVFAHLGYKEGAFPVAEAQTAQILSLPIYPELSEAQIIYIAETIRDFFRSL